MDDLIHTAVLFFDRIRTNEFLHGYINLLLTPGWWQLLLCFFACSVIMIFRLNAIEKNGFEGTLIGTLIMPYFSGFPNLCFAYLLIQKGAKGRLVLENCLVNNITNLTIILGVPTIIWGLNLYKNSNNKTMDLKINHLSLLLSILALIFFALSVFFVSKDGLITASDGMLLVGIFLFWQLYHVFDVLKNNTRTSRRIKKRLLFEFIIIGLCAWGVFSSIEYLIQWVHLNGKGFFSATNLGLLSGLLMVIPNAVLAIYYTAVRRPEIVYSSQIGDCHICIPLCVGLFAVFSPIKVDASFMTAFFILMGTSGAHFLFTAIFGRLPRFAGVALTVLYAFFIYKEVI
ncbi:MAG: hypothetical protein L3J69_17980 [Desulfobacula sp.]|nr:hypothetical protein [Desulfobacula sp.]